MPTQTFEPRPGNGANAPGNTNMGLPQLGYVPANVLAAMYPWATFGPTQAQQMTNLQFGANLDAQNQNNALGMSLAQGAASNRFADNIGSKLAIQGLGPVPGFGSAFQGGFGVHQVNPGNIFNMYGQATRPLNAVDALNAQRAGDPWTKQYIENVSAGNAPQPTVPGAFRNPGIGGFGHQTMPLPGLAAGGTIPPGGSAIVGEGGGPELATNTGFGTQVQPFTAKDALSLENSGFGVNSPEVQNVLTSSAKSMVPTTSGGFSTFGQPNKRRQDTGFMGMPLSGGFGASPGNAFSGVSQLAGFGADHRPAFGAGPRSFSDSVLGISNVMAPWANAAQYYGLSPDQQQAQDYMLQLFGYSPQMAQFQRSAATPGFRFNQTRGFGY